MKAEGRRLNSETIEGLLEALDYGIENTKELLALHDVNLGRSIPRNKATAESLEMEISAMETWRDRLEEFAGAWMNF